jgi:hypothetical protein
MNKIFLLLRLTVFMLIACSGSSAVAADECDCAASFSWLVEAFSVNDAGFGHVLATRDQSAYEQHTEVMRARAEAAGSCGQCRETLWDWLSFFRTGHIYIALKELDRDNAEVRLPDEQIREKYRGAERIDLTVDDLKARLTDRASIDPLEGIWQSGSYRVGIIEDDQQPGSYVAFIIEGDGVYWMPGQIKSRFERVGQSETYETAYALRDHTLRHGITTFGNPARSLFSISLFPESWWVRVFPEAELTPAEVLETRAAAAREPFVEQLGERTVYVRIPSFHASQADAIERVLEANDELIRATPNLIVDIRDGTGGSDHAFYPLLPYLYTNPIRTIGVALYATEANARSREEIAEEVAAAGREDLAEHFRRHAARMRESPGQFVNPGETTIGTRELETILPYPARVGVIINRANGSTDEQFLLAARQSFKTKIFGRPTKGVLDISNMAELTSPDGRFELGYSISKSHRLPDYPIDGIGIQPDFFIDSEFRPLEWIEYVRNVLETGQ